MAGERKGPHTSKSERRTPVGEGRAGTPRGGNGAAKANKAGAKKR